MYESGSAWTQKGATLSDKSARKEFDLSQEDIIEAIRQGKLQYRQNVMHGNPYFRLLRGEVEALVKEKFGQDYFQKKQLKNELSQINRDLRKLKKQITSLEKRKAALLNELGE